MAQSTTITAQQPALACRTAHHRARRVTAGRALRVAHRECTTRTHKMPFERREARVERLKSRDPRSDSPFADTAPRGAGLLSTL